MSSQLHPSSATTHQGATQTSQPEAGLDNRSCSSAGSARSAPGQLLALLACKDSEAISELCWSPAGRHLAAASARSPGFTVWDVACQACQRVSAGVEPSCCRVSRRDAGTKWGK